MARTKASARKCAIPLKSVWTRQRKVVNNDRVVVPEKTSHKVYSYDGERLYKGPFHYDTFPRIVFDTFVDRLTLKPETEIALIGTPVRVEHQPSAKSTKVFLQCNKVNGELTAKEEVKLGYLHEDVSKAINWLLHSRPILTYAEVVSNTNGNYHIRVILSFGWLATVSLDDNYLNLLRLRIHEATSRLVAMENVHFLRQFPLVWAVECDPHKIYWYHYPYGNPVPEVHSDQESEAPSDSYYN